jgi:4-hydroxy-tetrahydrodipicolinate synthase
VQLWELTVSKADIEGARRLWDAFYPVNHFFESEGYAASVKAATELRGIPVGHPRLPSLPLSNESRARLEQLLRVLDEALDRERVLS